MAKKTKKNHKSLTSLLRYQKPKKKKSSQASLTKKKLFLYGLLIALCVSGAAAFWWLGAQKTEPLAYAPTFNFSGSLLRNMDSQKIAELQKISAEAYKNSRGRLSSVSESIQKSLNASEVTAFKTSFGRVHIQVEPRIPLFKIKADKVRYVSTRGALYGVAEKNDASVPFVKGILENTRRLKFQKDKSAKLTEKEQLRIEKLLTLHRATKDLSLTVSEYKYIPFRGFQMVIGAQEIQVLIGEAPFERNLSKLVELLEEVKASDKKISLIEMDYNGKAFIKEKEL